MNWIPSVKRLLPLSWKCRLRYLSSPRGAQAFHEVAGRRKVVVALAADYPNLGDIGISYAQAKFIEASLPDLEVLDFPCAVTFTAIRDLAAACTTEDIITIVGGGNMCDLYASIEDARRFVVGRFPRNRIISFPQTMDFSDTARGRRELRKSQRAYGRHRHLRLFAREALSLERMRAAFPDTDVQLVPDIVLSVDASASEGIRRGTLLCIRNDYESVIPESVRRNLVLELSRTLEDVSVTDTVLAWERRLSREEREAELDAVLRRFRAAEVVVTDRLHGMIFAAITKTPCVALRNSNHKIAATHREWLGHLSHVAMVAEASVAGVSEAVARVRAVPASARSLPSLEKSFLPLEQALREAAQ